MPSKCSTHFSSFWSKALGSLCVLVVSLIFLSLPRTKEVLLSSASEEVKVKVETYSTGTDEVSGGENDAKSVVRVLCYGDSLTAGMAPPSRALCPYANSLQEALEAKNINSTSATSKTLYQVDHIGLPGYTTAQFLEVAAKPPIGLKQDLSSHPSTDVVVLLGGTNDLRRVELHNDKSIDTNSSGAQMIVDNLIRLHDMALASGAVHTIAVAIPPAGQRVHRPSKLKMEKQINQLLQDYATANSKLISYVEVPFSYEEGGSNWSVDHLHFSCEGYDILGKYLASTILYILQSRH